MATIRFEIEGVSPLLLSNVQLADPQSAWVREIKAITGKRKKTDADMDEIARLEFLASFHVDQEGLPCITGERIEAMLQQEGAKSRMKGLVKAGIISDGNFVIQHDGPRLPSQLWEKRAEYEFRRAVKNNGGGVVMRSRPIFRKWSLGFSVEVIEEEISTKTIRDFVPAAGRHTGMGSWRPKFGRFLVNGVKEEK